MGSIPKKQHFVPQHYLRQFRIEGTNRVCAARLDPYQLIGPASIRHQCQEDYFYGKDGRVEMFLSEIEADMAPVLRRIDAIQKLDDATLQVVRMMAALLHHRTRKTSEIFKLPHRKLAYEIVKAGIASGELPPPPGGIWTEEMMDIEGMPEFLLGRAVGPCWLEMQTLAVKFLRPVGTKRFITSDNPSVAINQLCMETRSERSFVGFSRTGFQLVLPISPLVCVFFYDPDAYKVGPRNKECVEINDTDVDAINSLQIQSADRCIYFHTPDMACEVYGLARDFECLRKPIKDALRIVPGSNSQEEILHSRKPKYRLKNVWEFCRQRFRPENDPGRRNEGWSLLIQLAEEDIVMNPGSEDILTRFQRIASEPESNFQHRLARSRELESATFGLPNRRVLRRRNPDDKD